MSEKHPVSSEQAKAADKPKFNHFVFSIVSQMSLDEFKKYTNIPDLVEAAIKTKLGDTKLPNLDSYIKKNFKINLPNEKIWRGGGFRSLTLTNEFYGSDAANRIFKKIYGVKRCKVNLSPLGDAVQKTNNVDKSDVEDDDDVFDKIDLTKDELQDNFNPPKRKLIYPRKVPPTTLPSTSGIAAYTATRIFVDQIPTVTSTNRFNDEIEVSSNESIVAVNHPQPNEAIPVASSKRVEVISQIVLVPPTPFRDETIQQHPGPKEISRVALKPIINHPPVLSSVAVPSKSKMTPESKVQRRTPRVVYIEEESQELQLPLPQSVSAATSPQNVSSAKPKTRIDTNAVKEPAMSTQELLQNLMHTDPSQNMSINKQENIQHPLPKRKPRIGPKSVMNAIRNSTIVRPPPQPEQMPQSLMHPDPMTVPVEDESHKEGVSTKPKQLIGPTSQMKKSVAIPTPLTTQELVEALSETDTSPLQTQPTSTIVTDPEGDFGSYKPTADIPASSKNDNLSKSMPLMCTQVNIEEFYTNWCLEHTNAKPKKNVHATPKNLVTELPSQSCLVQTSPNKEQHIRTTENIFEIQRDPAPKECIENSTVESPSNRIESADVVNNSMQSFDALYQRAREQFVKYVTETEPSAVSVKHFWYEFLKSDYETDSSAAETQLNENVDDDQLEPQSQAVLSPNQLEVQTQAILDPKRYEVEEPTQPALLPVAVELILTQDPLSIQPFNFLQVQIKQEKNSDCGNNCSWSSDVEIIEMPPSEPIEILMDSTQELVENLLGDAPNMEEELIEPFVMPQQPIAGCSKTKSPGGPSKSKGFLTSLPKVTTKKRNYPPLEIVVEAAQKVPPVVLPMYDFSQQPDTPPSNENYEIEECTMTDSQQQRYELLNNENTMFLSSQLENYALNTGQTTGPKSAIVPQMSHKQPVALMKRSSTDVTNSQRNKRRRCCSETMMRELNWKIMDIRSITFKPSTNNIFHVELQLRNNFDTFHVQNHQSIKRLLHLHDNEWKHIAKILKALDGHRYSAPATAITPRKLDIPSRLMDCFIESIPLFVRSNVQFNDFMGHCVEVSEQQPLINQCVDAAIDPKILKKMKEFKQNFCGKD